MSDFFHTPLGLLVFVGVFSLVTLSRFAINVGILERPLVHGLIWGGVTGQWSLCLGVAIFFEMYWLDRFPAGTVIPPNGLLATYLAMGLGLACSLSSPGAMMLPLALGVIFGLVGGRLEHFQRRRQDLAYNQLLRWARRSHKGDAISETSPEGLVLKSLTQIVGLHLALASVSLFGLVGLFEVLGFAERLRATSLATGDLSGLTWGWLWFVAALGGVASLRLPRAQLIYLCGVAGLAVSGLVFVL